MGQILWVDKSYNLPQTAARITICVYLVRQQIQRGENRLFAEQHRCKKWDVNRKTNIYK